MKKLFVVPLLLIGLLLGTGNSASAAYGPVGDCNVRVNVDAYNYYQPGAITVDFFGTKPSSSCGPNLPYQVIIEKYVNGKWVYKTTVRSLEGYFTYQTPTKKINIDSYIAYSGTYRVNLWLSDGVVADYGNAYSHSFNVHY